MYGKKSYSNTYLNNGKFFYVSVRNYHLTNGKMPFIRLLVKYTGDNKYTHIENINMHLIK